jgi:hypothetical protein
MLKETPIVAIIDSAKGIEEKMPTIRKIVVVKQMEEETL